MDSDGLINASKERKHDPINKGGIQASKNMDVMKNSNVFSQVPNPEMDPAYKQQNGRNTLRSKRDQEDDLIGFPIEDNEELIQKGQEMLGKVNEREYVLDYSDDQIEDILEQPVRVHDSRRLRAGQAEGNKKNEVIKADEEMMAIGTVRVKKGRFSHDQLEAGKAFMRKVDAWAGKSNDMSEEQRKFYSNIGSEQTISYLYVDGMPLREFVSKTYGYKGSNNPVQERDVLSAYAAMIVARMNHAMTLVRPTFVDGHADVDIRNVTVSRAYKGNDRGSRIKNVQQTLRGRDYRKYCEDAYTSQVRSKSAEAARKAIGVRVKALDDMARLKEELNNAGKGKHQDYNEFVWYFNKYYDAIVLLVSDPENMEINEKTLKSLDSMCDLVKTSATSYLKGKKMNLPRHHAVRNIQSLAEKQSAAYWGVLRGKALSDGGTISLGELLDQKEEGFVVMGLEEEVQERRHVQESKISDKNKYEVLGSGLDLTVGQKRLLKLKNVLDMDEPTKVALLRLRGSADDVRMTEEAHVELAEAYLKVASATLYANDKYRDQIAQRYPYAEGDSDLIKLILARTQLTKAYADDFKKMPSLKKALDRWSESLASREARAMTYQENVLGDKVSKKEFDEKGGAARHRYVSAEEAKDIVKASKGFLAAKEVKGKPGMVELVHTLPENITLNKGKDNEETIPLRRTMKAIMKTYSYMTLDKHGQIRLRKDVYKNDTTQAWMDKVFRAETDSEEFGDVIQFLKDKVLPDMKLMLEEEYRKNGMRAPKVRANNDAMELIGNFEKILRAAPGMLFSRAPEIMFEKFMVNEHVIRSVTADEIMNHRAFKRIKMEGGLPSKEDVEEVLAEMKAEMNNNVKEYRKIGQMNLDDEEVPGVSSCMDNMVMNELLLYMTNGSANYSLEYEYKRLVKRDTGKAIDMLVKKANLLTSGGLENYEKSSARHRQQIRELDQKYKEGKLGKEDMDTLVYLYSFFVKYDVHRAANMGTVGNATYTHETFAVNPNELPKSPFTLESYVGKYVSDKEMVKNDEKRTLTSESMNSYYDKDDAYAYTSSRKDIIRLHLKDVISAMGNEVIRGERK